MVLNRAPPLKRKRYRKADFNIKDLVEKAVKKWASIEPMEYLSGIAYNFRIGKGPLILPRFETESNNADEEGQFKTI